MSSARYPGKVLAPFRGMPLVDHVVDAVRRAGVEHVVVATSEARSDDPLAHHLFAAGTACFRGPLDDVVERFWLCAQRHPCDWILRICADSPLLEPAVIRAVVRALPSAARDRVALVTTTAPRTFPKGMNVEAISTSALDSLRREDLSAGDREHLTRYMHQHSDSYALRNVESGQPSLAELELAVDTIEDLRRLEQFDSAPLAAALARLDRDA
jgi:spore coat polysaccharide biosynthesis protein SpsF